VSHAVATPNDHVDRPGEEEEDISRSLAEKRREEKRRDVSRPDRRCVPSSIEREDHAREEEPSIGALRATSRDSDC